MLVGVQDGPAVQVARGAADGLDQRALGAQEAFLVGIEDGHQRHLGNVQALAQQVDADQHVEGAQPQVAQDLDPLHRVDVAVQVAHLHAVVGQVVGQLLGHALGQRGDQHALVLLDADADFLQHVVDLVRGRAHLDLGVDQAGRAAPAARPPGRRAPSRSRPAWPRRRSPGASRVSNSSNFSGRLSSADGRRKPYSTSVVLRERSPLYMAAELADHLVALVQEHQRVLGQVVGQRRRRRARAARPTDGACSSRCPCSGRSR